MNDGDSVATLHGLLEAAARRWPKNTAVCTTSSAEQWSYAELDAFSRHAAAWLSAHHVISGDRVVAVAPNRVELVVLIFAASRMGATFVLVDPRTKPFHLAHILADASPRLVLTDQQLPSGLSDPHSFTVHPLESLIMSGPAHDLEAVDADTNKIACLIYTSGSTAMPKAVVESQSQMTFAAAAVASRLRYAPGDRVLCCLPLSFDYGLYQVFLATLSGATLVLGTDRDSGPGLLRVLQEQQISVFPVVPILLGNLVRLAKRRPTPLPRLRLVTNTGAALSGSAIASLREHFPAVAVVLMFGLTECKRVSILEPDGDHDRPGSVGQPIPGTRCRIVDEAGTSLPPGEVGELVVQGPHVMTGYWRAADLTAERFRTGPDGIRELFTGDQCSMDDDGYLYFAGRRDDIYKQRGTRLSALEVEAAALDIPDVHEAAILVPAGELGAQLVVAGDLSSAAVMAALSERLPAFKLPSGCTIMERLPRTPNGKVDKRLLQDSVPRSKTDER